jgi:hypothetical protein
MGEGSGKTRSRRLARPRRLAPDYVATCAAEHATDAMVTADVLVVDHNLGVLWESPIADARLVAGLPSPVHRDRCDAEHRDGERGGYRGASGMRDTQPKGCGEGNDGQRCRDMDVPHQCWTVAGPRRRPVGSPRVGAENSKLPQPTGKGEGADRWPAASRVAPALRRSGSLRRHGHRGRHRPGHRHGRGARGRVVRGADCHRNRAIRREERVARLLDLIADLGDAGTGFARGHAGVLIDVPRLRLRAAISATGEPLPKCDQLLDVEWPNYTSDPRAAEHEAEALVAVAAALDEVAARLVRPKVRSPRMLGLIQ